MALVNPNIAMSYRGVEIPQQNALADYAAIQQIQGGRQAQELNALKIQEYERSRAEEEGLRNYLAQADLAKPETRSGILRFGKTGLAYGKALGEQETAALTKQKTGLEVKEKEFDLKRKKLESSVRDFTNFNTVSDVLGHIQRQLAAGEIDQQQAQQLASQVPQTDAELPVFQIAMLRRTLGAKDQLEQTKVTTKDTDRGGYVERQTYDSQGKPVGAPVKLPKTATIGETTAQGQLTLAKNKFAWEQQNPGFELKESEDGTIMAINKRTLQAVPVTVGGAAPAAAPAAAGAGVPATGARVPAAAAPLAGATPTSGQPLRGKGKEAPVKFNDTDLQLSGLAGSLQDFKKEVSKDVFTGAKFLPTGQDTARMQAKYTALLMGVKDLYTLGALTGPDMSIIESQLTNPASWSGKFTTKEGFEAQTKVIEDMLKRSATNLENTYSRVPKATKKALADLGSAADGAGVDASNPLLRP